MSYTMAAAAVITATVAALTFINISDLNGDSNYTEPKILPLSVKLAGASFTTTSAGSPERIGPWELEVH